MKTTDFLKREWVIWILILSPIVFVLMYWADFPEKVPMHWNMNNEVDRYGGKWALFLSPGLNLGIYFLLLFIPKIDPRKKNYDLFSGTYWFFRIILSAILALLGFVTALASKGVEMNVGLIVITAVTSLFLLIGNQMGRIRPNYFVGVRTPWTLNNEEVWAKTHRATGRVWVIASLLMIPVGFLLPVKIMAIIFFVYIAVLVAFPLIYSWRVHKLVKG